MSTDAKQVAKRVKTKYSDERVAQALLALKANGGNLKKTAREENLPRQTLASWANGDVRSTPKIEQIQHEKEAELAPLLRGGARLFFAHATKPEVIEKMDGLQAMKAAGIAIDKAQLLDGLPTSITADIDRQELSITLTSALAELDETSNGDPLGQAKNITPELASFGRSGPQDIAVFQE